MSEFKECQTPDAAQAEAEWHASGATKPPRAVMQARLAMLGGLLLCGVPYLVSAALPKDDPKQDKVADFMAWLPEDGTPFLRIFEHKHTPVVVADADPTGGGDAPIPETPELVIEPVAVEPTKSTTTVVDVVEAAPDAAPSDPDSEAVDVPPPPTPEPPEDPYARIHIPPETWAGMTTFIEDPNNVLATFYDALAKAALKTPNHKVLISQWGDSCIAADGMTSAARRLLQRVFGDGGHGYMMLAANNPWYRQKDIDLSASGWTAEEFIRDQAEDGRYGYGGVAAVGYQGSKASFATVTEPASSGAVSGAAASQMLIYYLVQKGGGTLTAKVDGVEKATYDTRSPDGEKVDKLDVVKVEDGAHTFELRNSGGGKTKVYGVSIERDQGLVYDGMGTVGARDTRWLNADKDHTERMLKMRSPDLAILMYGGNALVDDNTMEWYEGKLTEVVRIWREALPNKACLLMSPIDHGERCRKGTCTVPRQLDLMKVQRKVALAEGCAWFSIYDAMGGEGTIGKWLDTGLANSDLSHPTGKGSVELGLLWYKALMKGFADFITTHTPTP